MCTSLTPLIYWKVTVSNERTTECTAKKTINKCQEFFKILTLTGFILERKDMSWIKGKNIETGQNIWKYGKNV